MPKARLEWVLGVELHGPVLGVWTWILDGFEFGYGKSKFLTRGPVACELEVVGAFPCRKAAVAYSLGLHDGMGLSSYGVGLYAKEKGSVA